MQDLGNKDKQLLAFALFTFAMRTGPEVFPAIERIARQLGCEPALAMFAADWVACSKTVNQAQEQGLMLFHAHLKQDNENETTQP